MMKRFSNACTLFISVLFFSNLMGCSNENNPSPPNSSPTTTRTEVDFNFGWKFSQNDNKYAYQVDHADEDWRAVRLPHDWSIEKEYSEKNTAGATGYLPGGIGWYRKHFATPNGNGKTQILFDGIYNHSEIWINGHSLGKRPSGYAPFYHDLTSYLNKDGSDNVIAVFVDRTRYVDSRWYTGSGIYRNVKLITTNKVHVPIWGTFITTPAVNNDSALVNVKTTLKNQTTRKNKITQRIEIFDPQGKSVSTKHYDLILTSNQTIELERELRVSHPQLWDIQTPNLYSVITTLSQNNNVLDTTTTRFGIRTLTNDPATGFSLNGKNIKIKGVNIHHDAGLVGSAVPKGVWKRRLKTLKAAGVNAIRTAHNPASEEFLDLCDEMGFLVQAEAFDEWDNPKDKRKNFNQQGQVDYITESYSKDFPQWAERDLKAMLMRDRNHPSIIQWSIGNEIEWTYPRYSQSAGYWNNDNSESKKVSYYWDEPPFTEKESKAIFNSLPVKGAVLSETAKKLADWTREIDTSRPVTANLVIPSVSHYSGYTDALDIVGYSYRQSVYEYGHAHYPEKMIMGTENWVRWHEWKHVLDKAYIPGIFVWTGIDYLGESNGQWPKKGSSSGMIDFAGFVKPSYHMMKTIWSDTPHLAVTTQTEKKSAYKAIPKTHFAVEKQTGQWKKGKWGWQAVNTHWQYTDNEMVMVEVYSNVEEVELLLNNQSLGKQRLSDNPDSVLKWAVPYEKGKLTAKAIVDGRVIETSLTTAGKAYSISLTTDKVDLNADGYDVAHITAQVIDQHGIPVTHLEENITFTIEGDVKLLGVDNGDPSNIQKHLNNVLTTHKGRALLIVQSHKQNTDVTILARAEALTSNALMLKTR